MRRLVLLSLSLGAASLTACTGTQEDPLPVSLVTADSGGNRLNVARFGEGSGPGATQPAPSRVLGLATVRNGARVAAAFSDRVDLLDLNLAVKETARVSGGSACFEKLRADDAGTRFAVLSSCPNEAQRLVLFDATPAQRLSYTLPGVLTFRADQLFFAPLRDGLVLTQPTNTAATVDEVVRADPDGPDADADPDLTVLLSAALGVDVTDLAVLNANVYVAATVGGSSGVYQVGNNALGSAVIQGGVTRLFAGSTGQRLLVAWSRDRSALIITNFSATITLPGYSDVRDVAFAPDGYLYVVEGSGVRRVDVARLVENPGQLSVVSLSDGQFGAAVLP